MTQTLSQIRTYQQFIGGEFVDAVSGETLEVENLSPYEAGPAGSGPVRAS